jgi:hypothetical protein
MAEVRLSEQLEAENEDTGTGHLQGTCGTGSECEETSAAETGKQFSVALTPSLIDLETSK